MGADFIGNAILVLVPMILSLTVHEFAHALLHQAESIGLTEEQTAIRESDRILAEADAKAESWGFKTPPGHTRPILR